MKSNKFMPPTLKAINWPCAIVEDLNNSRNPAAHLPPNTVIVSICNDHVSAHPDVAPELLHHTVFWDIKEPLTHKGETGYPMSAVQAVEMLRFIRVNEHKNFWVHCSAGVSRSSAVCLFIHNVYGHALRDEFWTLSEPNTHVLGLLFREHYRLMHGSERIKSAIQAVAKDV